MRSSSTTARRPATKGARRRNGATHEATREESALRRSVHRASARRGQPRSRGGLPGARCMVAKVSASMLTETVAGRTPEGCAELVRAFDRLVLGDFAPVDEALECLRGVGEFPLDGSAQRSRSTRSETPSPPSRGESHGIFGTTRPSSSPRRGREPDQRERPSCATEPCADYFAGTNDWNVEKTPSMLST